MRGLLASAKHCEQHRQKIKDRLGKKNIMCFVFYQDKNDYFCAVKYAAKIVFLCA
jgi:outer membrane protein assembly factor BamD (BamD/ComL family)